MRHRKMMMTAAVAASAGLALTACSGGATAIGSQAASAPRASSSPAQPATKAGARAAASDYFTLYSAGQYAASYPMLSSAARRAITEHVWAAVHQGCKSPSAGMAYKVGHVVLAGSTAVVTVSLAGVLSRLASETATFTYSGGRWEYDPSDMGLYRHATVAADIRAARAKGYCGS